MGKRGAAMADAAGRHRLMVLVPSEPALEAGFSFMSCAHL